MKFQREIEGVKYDYFFGRVLYSDGRESFVSVDLRSGGMTSYDSCLEAYASIAKDVLTCLNERRIPLIDRAPSILEDDKGLTLVPFIPDSRDLIREIVELVKNPKSACLATSIG